jgi:hypothetical protein
MTEYGHKNFMEHFTADRKWCFPCLFITRTGGIVPVISAC